MLKLQHVDLAPMPSLDSLPVLAALPPRRVEDCDEDADGRPQVS